MKTGIDSNNRRAYDVLHTLTNEKGEYIPIICIEGEKGYHKTDWAWGSDYEFAKGIAEDKNRALGLTKKDAAIICASTYGRFPKGV